MTDLEQELQGKASILLSALRFGNLLTQVETELECLTVIANYSQKAYDNPKENAVFDQAKKSFESSLGNIRKVFGGDTIQALYTCFKKVANTPELMKKLYGVASLPEGMSFDALFQQAFNKAKENVAMAKEENGGIYWNNIVSEILNPVPVAEEDTQDNVVCPICGSIATLQPSELYAPGLQTPFVWGCECGAYALADANNEIVGTLAGAELHQRRASVRKAISETCETDGVTLYECLRVLSAKIGKRIRKLEDVEYLNEEDCDRCLDFYLEEREKKRREHPVYPKTQGELMRFFEAGGRARVLDSVDHTAKGKLLIPVAVGPSSLIIRGKKGHEILRFPSILEYTFRGNVFSVIHPSGEKDRYQLYPLKRSF